MFLLCGFLISLGLSWITQCGYKFRRDWVAIAFGIQKISFAFSWLQFLQPRSLIWLSPNGFTSKAEVENPQTFFNGTLWKRINKCVIRICIRSPFCDVANVAGKNYGGKYNIFFIVAYSKTEFRIGDYCTESAIVMFVLFFCFFYLNVKKRNIQRETIVPEVSQIISLLNHV